MADVRDATVERFVALGVLLSVAIVFSPLLQDRYYRQDDYWFLAQVVQSGLLKSLFLPFHDHLFPLYRLFMGGLYLRYEPASFIRSGILIFHLVNTYLIYLIVNRHSKSVTLAAMAALAFGFSRPAEGSVIWCITGCWTMSLTFVLFMSVCFEKFLETTFKDVRGAETAIDPSACQAVCDDTSAPAIQLRYYLAGLLSFIIALGTYTIGFFGGVIVWLYMYVRLLRQGILRGRLFYHISIFSSFLAVLSAYLVLRSLTDADKASFPLIENRPFSLVETIDAVKELPFGFYDGAAKRMLPYQRGCYLFFPLFFALLLIQKRFFKRNQSLAVIFWLIFAVLTFAVPILARLPLIRQLPHTSLESLLKVAILDHYYYFCYPVAGISIAFALVLSPPPGLAASLSRCSRRTKKLLVTFVFLILFIMNYPSIQRIRSDISQTYQQDIRFHNLVAEYEKTMLVFLNSPAYSAEKDAFYFDNGQVEPFTLGSSNWMVSKRDIFQLRFPQVKNIYFTNAEANETTYLWTIASVSAKQ